MGRAKKKVTDRGEEKEMVAVVVGLWGRKLGLGF